MKSTPTHVTAVPVKINRVTAAVAMALSGLAPHALLAQEAAVTSGPDELVVTATRRDTTVQDVPYSIAALSAEELRRLQVEDLSGVARWTPGLIQVDQGGRDANVLIIRGISSRAINSPEFLANTTGDRVATYYGETPVYVDLRPIDLARIEVLRGPQGTVYGARSLAGAVRYMPNRPNVEEFSIDARAIGASTDQSSGTSHEGSVVLNMPLIEDTLALRALVGYANDRGFIDYNFLVPEPGVSCPEPGFADPDCSSDGFERNDDANSLITRSYGLALRWDMSDTLTATLLWRQQNQDSGGRNVSSRDALQLLAANRGITIDNDPYVAGLRFNEPNSRINNIANLTIDWETSIGSLRSTTSFTSFDERGQRDQTDLLLDLEPDDYYYYEEFPAFSAFTRDTRDDEIFTQEVRLVSPQNDDGIQWLVGAFYQDGDFSSRNTEITPGYAAFDPLFTDANGDIEFDNKTFQTESEFALFGEIGFDITDRFNLLFGARWFDFDFDIRSCTAFPIASTAFGGSPDVDDPSNCSPNTGFTSVSDSRVLGKVNATYTFNDNVIGYFTFSQGYSAGGANARLPADLPETLVESESTDNYELGLKSQWLDNRLTVNGALYYIDWTDIQVPGQPGPLNTRITRNGGTAESMGVELDTVLRLDDHWTLAAGYAYTYAELTEGCNNGDLNDPGKQCVLPGEPTASGDRLPGSPEHQGNIRVTYENSLNADMDLRLLYGITAQSDVLTRLGDGRDCCRDNGEALPGFALHNAAATLVTANWEAKLFVENLFNRFAVTGVREDRSTLTTAGGPPDFTLRRYFQNVVRPRTVGVDLLYKFR